MNSQNTYRLPARPLHCYVLLAFFAFLLAGCYGGKSSSADDSMDGVIPAVEAVKARFGTLPLTERLSGTVRAENQVMLMPEISAQIERVYVDDGDQVRQGDPLVKLEDDQYREQLQQARAGASISEAQLKQAESRLAQQEAQLRRMQQLRDKGLSSEQEYENILGQTESARAAVDLAKAQLQQARALVQEQQNLLAKTVIRAPISGTIGQRNAEIGMQVSTGTQLFIIGDLGEVTVEVVLTEDMLNKISVGQRAVVYANPGSEQMQPIAATVARISPFLNNVTRSTEAEIEVKNSENLLKPGMFVPVDILYGDSQQATLVPTSAIYTNPANGSEGIFVAPSIGFEIEPADSVNPDRPPPLTEPADVQFQEVEIIARGRMEVAVDGIQPGTWVVTVGQNLLSQGRNQARIRTVDWERILSMQQLQRQDLLNKILQRQNRQEQDTPS